MRIKAPHEEAAWNIFKDSKGHLLKRSGHNEREVHPKDFVSLVKDIFDVAIYGKLLADQPPRTTYTEFQSNESFWSRVIKGEVREGMRAVLPNFYVTEWIPISPGRFFMPEAAAARQRALQYVYEKHEEFLPLGKSEMVLGGIGCVRLKSRIIDRDRLFFVGATSSGVSHEGIPLLVRHEDVAPLLASFARDGGVRCDVSGWIRILPEELSLIGFSSKNEWGTESGLSTALPKYCIDVERIRIRKSASKGELLTTVAIMFPTAYYRGGDSRAGPTFTLEGYDTHCKKSWSFCSFDPCEGNSAMKAAATWLQDYAGRYSEKLDEDQKGGNFVPIFCDFDEHCDHFPNKVEFPLMEICAGMVNLERLKRYHQVYGFLINVNANNVIMGDQIEQNVHGGTFYGPVAAKMEHCTIIIGKLENDQRKQFLAELQKEATGLIQRLPDDKREDAADNLKLLVDSIAAKEPKRQWYEVSARGLMDASKFVKDFTGNIAGTIGQLGKLLWPDFQLPNPEKK